MRTKKIVVIMMTVIAASYHMYALKNDIKPSSLTLNNIEALAGDENLDKFDTSEIYTWQEGPYFKRVDDDLIMYYWVYTQTQCYGTGVVDCTPDLSGDVVYVD